MRQLLVETIQSFRDNPFHPYEGDRLDVYYSEPLIEYAPDCNACRAYDRCF